MDLAFAFALLAASAAIIDATERATLEDAPRIADLAGAAEPSPTVTVAWVDAQSSLSDEATGSMIKEVNAVFRGPRQPPEHKCVRAVLAGLAALSEPRPVPGPAGLARSLLW